MPPPNIVRLQPSPQFSTPGRRNFVNDRPDELINQLRLMQESQGFQASEAGKSRDLSLLVALMNNENTREQLLQQRTESEGRFNYLDKQLAESVLDRKAMGEQHANTLEEHGRQHDDQITKMGERLDAENDRFHATMERNNRLDQAREDTDRVFFENEQYRRARDDIGNNLNNAIQGNTIAAGAFTAEAKSDMEDFQRRVAHEASTAYHVPELTLSAAMRRFVNNADPDKEDAQIVIDMTNQMIEHASGALADEDADVVNKIAALTLFAGNSSVGNDYLIDNMLDGIHQMAAWAEQHDMDDMAKKLRKTAKSLTDTLIAEHPAASRAIDQWNFAITRKSEINRVNQEVLSAAANTPAQIELERQRARLQSEDRISDIEGGVSRDRSPVESFGGPLVQPNFDLADADFSRLKETLSQGQMNPPVTRNTQATTIEGLQGSIDDILSEVSESVSEKQKNDREAPQIERLSMIDRMIRQMQLDGSSPEEIQAAIREAQGPEPPLIPFIGKM